MRIGSAGRTKTAAAAAATAAAAAAAIALTGPTLGPTVAATTP